MGGATLRKSQPDAFPEVTFRYPSTSGPSVVKVPYLPSVVLNVPSTASAYHVYAAPGTMLPYASYAVATNSLSEYSRICVTFGLMTKRLGGPASTSRGPLST